MPVDPNNIPPGYTIHNDQYVPISTTGPGGLNDPNAGANPVVDENIAPPPDTTITGSEEAANNLNDIDTMIDDIGLEMPETGESDALFKQAQDQLNSEYEQTQKDIKAGSEKRQTEQRQANKEIMGESKAALASMGLLSDEPGMASATNAVQYVADTEREGQKQIDQILAEEQQALAAARNAKSAGDLNLAKMKLDDARALREERNALKLSMAAETRAMRDAERADDRLAIDKLIENRAAKNFKREEAQSALDALIAVNFQGFDKMNPNEIKTLERKLGFIDGTLDAWNTQSQKLTALEGWSSTMQTNKNTGEVTAIYTRLNPDTGQPEYMKKSLGNIGERYQGSGASKSFKISADDRGKMLGAGISEADIDALDTRIRANGLTSEILDFLSDDQKKVVQTVYSGAQESVESAATIVSKIKAGGYFKVIETTKYDKDDNVVLNDAGNPVTTKEEVLDVEAIPSEVFEEVMKDPYVISLMDMDDPETAETLNWFQRQWQESRSGFNLFD